MKLLIKKLSEKATLPKRASEFSVGYDLYASHDDIVNKKGKSLVKTDIALKIPDGHYGRIAPRSGLACKNFIDVGAGVIDPDYRGNVCVLLYNHSDEDFKVNKGDRIAQLIIEKCSLPQIEQVDSLDETVRNNGGFGHTGIQ